MSTRLLIFVVSAMAMAALAAAGGCARENRITLESTTGSARLDTLFPTAVYSAGEATRAEFVLTDLSLDELDPASDSAALSGRIVRISMAIQPKAGATPMDPTSANATVQYLILSRGAVGLYSGGAFVNPGRPFGSWGSSALRARIRGGTLRLTASSPRFENRLGPVRMDAQFEAQPDEVLATRAVEKFDEIVAGLYREEQ